METKTSLSKELVNSLEEVEISAWNDFYSHTSDEVKRVCGIDYKFEDGVIYTAATKIDALALNRVTGFGLRKPLTIEVLKEAKNYFIKMKVPRFIVQLCPTVINEETENILKECGFSHYNNWVRLYRETETPPIEVNTNLSSVSAKEKHLEEFGSIISGCFGWPDELIPWFKGFDKSSRWYPYLVYDNIKPVATAAMFIEGDKAWFGMASTLPDYRRMGAQSLLISRRIKDAVNNGCKLLSVETAEDRPDHPAPSYHNILRMGFHEVYRRRNYIYYC